MVSRNILVYTEFIILLVCVENGLFIHTLSNPFLEPTRTEQRQ